MNQFSFWISFVLSVLALEVDGLTTATAERDKPTKCTLERSYKMLGYNCANLDLKIIPQYLKSNVEILDLSFNRLRDLHRGSFAKYSDIKYLYLFENMLQNIEEDTFKHLVDLEALDISNNALTHVPLELFSLPRLRNLYLHENKLRDLDRQLVSVSKPIKAPLKLFNLAATGITRLPDLGILPDLWSLNVSSNDLYDISVEQFSPLCSLHKIDLNNTRIPTCICREIYVFLTKKRDVQIESGFFCDSNSGEAVTCNNITSNATTESSVYHDCVSVKKHRIMDKEAKSTWFWVAASLGGFFVVFISGLYCIHRRNVRKLHTMKKLNNTNIRPVTVTINANDFKGPEKLLTSD